VSNSQPPLVRISRNLSRNVGSEKFAAPISYVYNPLQYARAPHEQYLSRYGNGPKQVVFVGMNPGPFGMAQTGVPFGEVSLVRDWMGITGKVGRPDPEHPKRRIEGFECKRSEVSGARLWGWAKARFATADHFFERFFVANYCPLVFMEESGRNFTPDKLPASERETLFAHCDRALLALVEQLSPQRVIGVGAFAQKAAMRALAGTNVQIGTILHPSPASPVANRGWAEQAEKQLVEQGVELP